MPYIKSDERSIESMMIPLFLIPALKDYERGDAKDTEGKSTQPANL